MEGVKQRRKLCMTCRGPYSPSLPILLKQKEPLAPAGQRAISYQTKVQVAGHFIRYARILKFVFFHSETECQAQDVYCLFIIVARIEVLK